MCTLMSYLIKRGLLGFGGPFLPVLYSVPITVETMGSLSVSTTVHTWIGTWGKEGGFLGSVERGWMDRMKV